MSQGPPAAEPQDDPLTISRNARYGIVIFLVYLAVYAAFVAMSAFAPEIMARPTVGGVNLAVAYGFGLIGLALLLAVVYMLLCGAPRGESGRG